MAAWEAADASPLVASKEGDWETESEGSALKPENKTKTAAEEKPEQRLDEAASAAPPAEEYKVGTWEDAAKSEEKDGEAGATSAGDVSHAPSQDPKPTL